MKVIVLATATLIGTCTLADAGTPWIKHRQHHQLARIGNGVATGALTPSERWRLLAGQARVSALRSAARADGVVKPGERIFIHTAQNWQSLRIYHLKHN